MTDTATAPTTLVLRRTVNATRDRVFAAWTTPEILRRFMAPEGCSLGEISVDARVGGAWHLEMKTPDGPMVVRGVYKELVPFERVVYTWKWDEDNVADEHESLVIVELHEKGAQTEVVLTHERLKDELSRDRHTGGWTDIVDNLVAEFA